MTGWGHGCTTLIITLSFTWAPGDSSKGSLSQSSLELGAAIWLSLKVGHVVPVFLNGKGCVLPFLPCPGGDWARAATTPRTHRCKQFARMAGLTLLALELSPLNCVWENHWILGQYNYVTENEERSPPLNICQLKSILGSSSLSEPLAASNKYVLI